MQFRSVLLLCCCSAYVAGAEDPGPIAFKLSHATESASNESREWSHSNTALESGIVSRNLALANHDAAATASYNLTEPLHVVFMGDSTYRYEYLGLIYYLDTGKMYHPHVMKHGQQTCRDMSYSHTCSCPPKRKPKSKRKSKRLTCNQHQSSYETISPQFRGRELCDCFRAWVKIDRDYTRKATENRCSCSNPLPSLHC